MSGGGGGGSVAGGEAGGGESGGDPRGGELVCRLVAATPPYLYSSAGLPHCFFFSELLRGLVRAKRALTPPPQPHWPQPHKRFRAGGHSSAFSVPPPRGSRGRPPSPAPPPANPLAPARVLHGLKRIYSAVADTRPPSKEGPLPAVIGLELVVDYVKHEKEPKVVN
ncbi:hypothetical protein AAG570_006313 [Ranatra chinensis]|uniref:Uncharacterized protein n=1 Tax=Ranatra chinensis TaxID=642074 RepID=A0ABD0Z6F4_9HEMI